MPVSQFTSSMSSGISVPTVSSPGQTSASVSLSWTAIPGSSAYDIFATPASGSRVYKTRVTGATTATISGLDSNTSYTWEVFASNASGVLVQATLVSTLPALTRYSILGGSMSLGSSNLTNDGSLWFWPTSGGSPQPGTMTADVLNQESSSIVEVTGVLLATSYPAAPFTQFGVLDGASVWRENRSIASTGSGATIFSPIVRTAVVDTSTNPIPGNGTVKIQHVLGSGEFSQCNNFSYNVNPNTVSNVGFATGDVGGTTPTYTTAGVGPFIPTVICKHSSGYSPKLMVCVFGDSTAAQIRPFVSASQESREGYLYEANNLARTNNKNIRYASFGQGTATWDQYTERLFALLPNILTSYFGLVLVQVATWNQPFADAAAATTRWNTGWLPIKANIEAAGLKALPIIMTPANSTTGAGNIAGYSQMRSLVSAAGGIDLIDSVSTDGIDITASISEDGVHINGTGALQQGTAFHNQVYAAAQAIGWSI